ncbi:MAG TPA: ABC transporter substrate-binding protein [Burkholderiales bacterium]|nr:ABC transporter substrate-binding protein [Burkholderiales bacterium]
MATRRAFIAAALGVIAAPLAAQEKKPGRIYRVGVLDPVSLSANAANINELRKGLRELGYVEGENLLIEYRSAEGRNGRYPQLAIELTGRKVDLIVARGTPATLAARSANAEIPVVTAPVVDPVETGLVASLARPGGNVTGLALLANELEAKRLDLLRALAPRTKRVAAIMNAGNPALAATWKAINAAAQSMRLGAQLVEVRRSAEIGRAFQTAKAQGADALVVRLGPLTEERRRAVAGLAAEHRLPAIYESRLFVDAGGLVSYGVSAPHLYYRAAAFVDKIFKGARPGELPMEQPTKFELIINRKAVKALDLVVPPDLLLRSNEMV